MEVDIFLFMSISLVQKEHKNSFLSETSKLI